MREQGDLRESTQCSSQLRSCYLADGFGVIPRPNYHNSWSELDRSSEGSCQIRHVVSMPIVTEICGIASCIQRLGKC